jgi:hypothetical protein
MNDFFLCVMLGGISGVVVSAATLVAVTLRVQRRAAAQNHGQTLVTNRRFVSVEANAMATCLRKQF